MKRLILAFSLFSTFRFYSQITQIATNSSATLTDISVIKKNIIVSGYWNYLAKCNGNCNILNQVALPGSTNAVTVMHRPDTNNVFLFYYNPNSIDVYKSYDGGNTWNQKYSTSGTFRLSYLFVDSLKGFLTTDGGIYKTTNGGSSWSSLNCPFSLPYSASSIKVIADSILCIGGENGNFYISYNWGNAWSNYWGFWMEPTDYCSLGKDTLLVISEGGELARSTDKGFNWQNLSGAPINTARSMYFKSKNEGYLVGSDLDGNGTVVKTTDLGQTWSSFNVGYKTTLYQIASLNDSIALMSGTGGILLKWNYKRTVFTSLAESKGDLLNFSINPNPTQGALYFNFKNKALKVSRVTILDDLGQIVYETTTLDEKLNVEQLPSGLYFINLDFGTRKVSKRFIKE